jgi:hypothetical protein
MILFVRPDPGRARARAGRRWTYLSTGAQSVRGGGVQVEAAGAFSLVSMANIIGAVYPAIFMIAWRRDASVVSVGVAELSSTDRSDFLAVSMSNPSAPRRRTLAKHTFTMAVKAQKQANWCKRKTQNTANGVLEERRRTKGPDASAGFVNCNRKQRVQDVRCIESRFRVRLRMAAARTVARIFERAYALARQIMKAKFFGAQRRSQRNGR